MKRITPSFSAEPSKTPLFGCSEPGRGIPLEENSYQPFSFGKAVYPTGLLQEKNLQICFPIDYEGVGEVVLRLSGENEYCVYLNGKLVGYGPAKAAHGYHRVDEYHLQSSRKVNRILILLAGYNVFSFDRIKQEPFIQFELFRDSNCLAYSSKESKAFLHKAHVQKVARFSYQRCFSESYGKEYTNQIFFPCYFPDNLLLEETGEKVFLPRNVSYPLLKEAPLFLVEKNPFLLNPKRPIHEDRYMYNEAIGIFPQKEWESDPNRLVSWVEVSKDCLTLSKKVLIGESLAYQSSISLTGFLHARIKVKKTAEIYFTFDEINQGMDGHIDFDPFRNATHNIVSYLLKPGDYELTSFLPYTIHFLRLLCCRGELEVESLGVIVLENPDVVIQYEFQDKKIQKIFDAACNTFRANALDILTDCPSRERAGWLCDSFFSGQVEAFLTGENKVERNFLENYALYRPHGDVEEGMIPMCYPADFPEHTFIPNWAMFYGLELLSYQKRNDDQQLLEKSIPNLEGILRYFARFENERGLLENLENWVFVEWSHENDPESIQGVNLPSNMLYASFLEATGILLKRPSLQKKADAIREEIRKLGFNGTYFVDNLIRDKNHVLKRSNRISETTQYYAFCSKTADSKDYPELFVSLLDEFGPGRDPEKNHPEVFLSNAFIGGYLRLMILLEAGYPEKVIQEAIAFFYPMAEKTGSLWEHSFVFGSLNHGFASYILLLLFEAITKGKGNYHYPYSYEIKIPTKHGFRVMKND